MEIVKFRAWRRHPAQILRFPRVDVNEFFAYEVAAISYWIVGRYIQQVSTIPMQFMIEKPASKFEKKNDIQNINTDVFF